MDIMIKHICAEHKTKLIMVQGKTKNYYACPKKFFENRSTREINNPCKVKISLKEIKEISENIKSLYGNGGDILHRKGKTDYCIYEVTEENEGIVTVEISRRKNI